MQEHFMKKFIKEWGWRYFPKNTLGRACLLVLTEIDEFIGKKFWCDMSNNSFYSKQRSRPGHRSACKHIKIIIAKDKAFRFTVTIKGGK
jgi:hypothetical protein